MIIGVLVELSNKNIDKIFDYLVPSWLEKDIKIGVRVEVPFGRQVLDGFVLEIKDRKDEFYNLKEIIKVKDTDVVLNDELLELGKTIKDKTLSTLISCYQVMLPKALKAKQGSNVNRKFTTFYKVDEKKLLDVKVNGKQEEIINLCRDKKLVKRSELVDISIGSLNTLLKKNILIEEKCECYRVNYSKELGSKYELTDDQNNVVKEVLKTNFFQPYLLHGVTGSGKTEVYMELIEDALNRGKSSIVLVPEISLTPQMVERFQKRFGDNIAALHSALSDGEKYDEWRRIFRGEASIVIGARSAIFAPLKNIGMIIIDEEHSESYKQSDTNPRYNAKDIALIRGRYHNCPVVMGSATPSLEVMARAQKGNYRYLSLPNRVNGKKMPLVRIIEMNEEFKKSRGHFSRNLITSIEDNVTIKVVKA